MAQQPADQNLVSQQPEHHVHGQGVPSHLKNTDAGQDGNSVGFQRQYDIVVNWDINCAACCWTYLKEERHYVPVQGDYDRVTFGNSEDFTSCFVAEKSPGNVNGQFKIYHGLDDDPEVHVLGTLAESPRTVKLYTRKDQKRVSDLQIGADINDVNARIVSIAIPSVTDSNINGSRLCYNHAALCELYRQKRGQTAATSGNRRKSEGPLPPLLGTCEAKEKSTAKEGEAVGDENISKLTKHFGKMESH